MKNGLEKLKQRESKEEMDFQNGSIKVGQNWSKNFQTGQKNELEMDKIDRIIAWIIFYPVFYILLLHLTLLEY